MSTSRSHAAEEERDDASSEKLTIFVLGEENVINEQNFFVSDLLTFKC